MNFFKQTTLIGIGLIGSSIARALKKKRLSKKICIFSRTKKTIYKAKKLKLGNFYTNDLEKSVKGSDLIIICTPLSTYKNILDKISKHIMPNTILTDVGSTKLNVVKIFSKLKNVKFNILPAHPIAGTEKSGPESGFAELFNKRWCVITPMGKNNKNSLNANAKEKSQIIKFSAGGFRDFTRIAASDATMWKDIFLNNKKNLLKTVNEFEKSLNLIKQYIKQNKSKKIQEVFIRTKKIRELIGKEKQE